MSPQKGGFSPDPPVPFFSTVLGGRASDYLLENRPEMQHLKAHNADIILATSSNLVEAKGMDTMFI